MASAHKAREHSARTVWFPRGTSLCCKRILLLWVVAPLNHSRGCFFYAAGGWTLSTEASAQTQQVEGPMGAGRVVGQRARGSHSASGLQQPFVRPKQSSGAWAVFRCGQAATRLCTLGPDTSTMPRRTTQRRSLSRGTVQTIGDDTRTINWRRRCNWPRRQRGRLPRARVARRTGPRVDAAMSGSPASPRHVGGPVGFVAAGFTGRGSLSLSLYPSIGRSIYLSIVRSNDSSIDIYRSSINL